MTSRTARRLVANGKAGRVIDQRMAERACGTCTACCTSQGVGELKKGPGVRCEHIAAKGCAIYARRPPSCAEWSCAWRMGEFHGSHRPDRVGAVIDFTEHSDDFPGGFAYVAREAIPGGLEKAEEFLKTLAQKHIVILACPDGKRRILGPPEHLGAVLKRRISFAAYDAPKRRLPLFDPGRDGGR